MFHNNIIEGTNMRKLFRLTAATLIAASAVVGTAALASADSTDGAPSEVRTSDVGWGVAPAESPQPSVSATATDVGWG